MFCRLSDLKNKCVINISNGSQLGFVYDVQIDTTNALVCALVLKGRLRLWGLLGRDDDIIVKWSDIEVIGEDTILINSPVNTEQEKDTKASGRLFHILTEDE